MIKDYYTAKEIADILDIYEVSAEELLAGMLEFEPDELLDLARAKNISLEELLR